MATDPHALLDSVEFEAAVEHLPWQETLADSSHVARVAFCSMEVLDAVGATGLFDEPAADIGWLWVEFKDGRFVAYEEAPRFLLDALVRAKSPGSALHRLVKGRYRYVGLNPRTGRKTEGR